MNAKAKYWLGTPPAKCDITNLPISDCFIDGQVLGGRWAIMTPRTHAIYGLGLGTGRGQKYQRQADGRFLKVEG
jgi:hypothetical protein